MIMTLSFGFNVFMISPLNQKFNFSSQEELMKKYIRELEYVENVATPQNSKLASKYLKLIRECPDEFDS